MIIHQTTREHTSINFTILITIFYFFASEFLFSSNQEDLLIENGRRRRRAPPPRRWGTRRRFQGESVEHDGWALLPAQALEAQHRLRHGWHRLDLYPNRHEIRRAWGMQTKTHLMREVISRISCCLLNMNQVLIFIKFTSGFCLDLIYLIY